MCLGLVMIAGGLSLARPAVLQSIATGNVSGHLCLWLFCGLLCLGGVGLVLCVDDLSLDLKSRRFRRREGLWPFCLDRTGELNQITLHVVREEREKTVKHAGVVRLTVTVARLHFADDSTPAFHLTESVDEARVREALAQLA
jgi:hypothetical protein